MRDRGLEKSVFMGSEQRLRKIRPEKSGGESGFEHRSQVSMPTWMLV
jgi:hypothetical protein